MEFHWDKEDRQEPAHLECNLMGRSSGYHLPTWGQSIRIGFAGAVIKSLQFLFILDQVTKGAPEEVQPLISWREGSPEGAHTVSSEVKWKTEKTLLPSFAKDKICANFWIGRGVSRDGIIYIVLLVSGHVGTDLIPGLFPHLWEGDFVVILFHLSLSQSRWCSLRVRVKHRGVPQRSAKEMTEQRISSKIKSGLNGK